MAVGLLSVFAVMSFCLFGNSENKLKRLEACVIIQKYANYAKYAQCAEYVDEYAITYAKKYAIKYVKFSTTFKDMQNMWIYDKYVGYAKYVK